MKTKLNYEVTSQKAYIKTLTLQVEFKHRDRAYFATGTYGEEAYIENIKVINTETDSLIDEQDIIDIAEEALYYMEISKETITY